jgi:hypothetical protein
MKRLGSQAAEQAKKSGDAEQKAEALANQLSGTEQKDAEQAAQKARQRAETAQAKADKFRNNPLHGRAHPVLRKHARRRKRPRA